MTSAQLRQLTRVLYGVVGALAALYLLLLAGFGRGVPGPATNEPEPLPTLQLSETQVLLPGLDVYDDLSSRPLFAEDRRPQSKLAAAPEPEPEAPPSSPLNVALTGIIHTPQAKIALVRDNSTGKSLSLRERMPLPGDQGGWLVKSIEPRRVIFEDTGGQAETAVDLPIGAAAAPSAAASRPANMAQAASTGGNAKAAEAPEEDAVARRAAEIRRRIEERRAQLRRDAQQSAKE